ncbi:hypothetical protein [Nocardioides okcheonensis]|uniref:hypothetical protein n=1 Tax=Nocardioides okcheonensis TaxID=2894081 RepID=UPI001E5CC2E7|nr:hypothetical protein [Nocardioides okcheonensis]UFN44510.1 hypothetical protein LN652_21115 [Nocardioides okcheonensis]
MSDDSAPAPTASLIRITGYTLLRSTYTVLYEPPADEDVKVVWKLLPGMMQDTTEPVIIGDLTSRTEDCFAGVRVAAYLSGELIDGISEVDWAVANALVTDNVEAVTDGLYDYAAQAMRAMTSGALFRPEVPDVTPKAELDLVDEDEA